MAPAIRRVLAAGPACTASFFSQRAADWVYTSLAAINLSWAQELATYMFVWMAKFGAALGVRTGIHVGVDVFVKRLTPAARKPVIVFALLCGALFTGVIGTLGAVYVYELDPDEVSPELEWPSWIIYLCIPLGSYLMCFRFLQVMWRFLRTGAVPHQGAWPRLRGAARGRDRAGRRGGAMIALSPTAKPAAPRPLGVGVTATLIIAHPACAGAALLRRAAAPHRLSHTVRAELLFALLLALMATGMPISIALGLSVLTYLFILSDVDPKMVGLKLFTSIDRFEIMAIPFFILAGNFLTTGGVARRMIDFATSLIGHWYGGLGLAGVVACALFAAISGSSVATVVGIGSIMLPALMQNGYPPRFGAGVIATSGALGILFPPSINLVIYRGGDQRHAAARTGRRGRRFRLGRPAVHGRRRARADPRHHARRDDLVSRLAQRLSAHGAGELGRMLARLPRKHLGPVADRPGARRHLFGPVHADRSRRRGRGLRLRHRRVRLQGTEALRGAGGAAQGGVDERDDPLHHHQRGGVLLAA